MSEPVPPVLPASPSPGSAQTKNTWAKPTLAILVVGVIGLNAALFIHSCRKAPGEVVEKAGRALAEVAAAFKQGRVTTEFISYATSLTNQQRLQFATLKQHELFTRKEEL